MLKLIRERIQDDKGFTLIELMVVVLIIAILIAIAIPTYLGLRQRAQDRAAQAELRDGLTAAKAYFTDDETFTGFDAEAANIEPSLTWNTAAAAVQGEVSIRDMGDDHIVLVTESESTNVFCAGDDGGTNVFGDDDAGTVGACTGGW
jgi:type IV pilus assembly protein PilA